SRIKKREEKGRREFGKPRSPLLREKNRFSTVRYKFIILNNCKSISYPTAKICFSRQFAIVETAFFEIFFRLIRRVLARSGQGDSGHVIDMNPINF
ncbi:MAG: hypothetical protein IJL42_01760, partial [Bacteroidales bacterium]|nr:hypothetical protein [Bacteroidales bacterium]